MRMNDKQQRVFHKYLGISEATSLMVSPFTRNTPITSSAKVRVSTCFTSCLSLSPFFLRLSIAKGSESPTMKRKAGNTTSARPIPSTPPSTCSSHPGILCSVPRSFTKIINTIVSALSISIEAMRRMDFGFVVAALADCSNENRFDKCRYEISLKLYLWFDLYYF